MQFILTDIEGTTTSVAFVYDILFPYFKDNIAAFLDTQADSVAEHLRAVQETVTQEGGEILSTSGLTQQLLAWTNADRKHPALKAIQGVLWRSAYETGEIKGHVYPDVPPALERWKRAGIGMGVYSSGSVAAQQLLFGCSEYGDLRPFFSHYFDTNTGPKREMASYSAIAEALQISPSDILFLSDIEGELDAAAQAGMHTTQLLRPGTEPGMRHKTVFDFRKYLFDRLYSLQKFP